MKDSLLFAGIFIAWIVLNRWVLPHFGVQTCMSGACARGPLENAASGDRILDKERVDAKELLGSKGGESQAAIKSPYSKALPPRD